MSTFSTPGVYVLEVPAVARPITGVGTSTAAFIGIGEVLDSAMPQKPSGSGRYPQKPAGKPCLVTSWEEFKQNFGDFNAGSAAAGGAPATLGNHYLAHAVYGFFSNGGTRCYVVRVTGLTDPVLEPALSQLAAIDEVAIVAAPLAPSTDALGTVQNKLLTHCQNLGNRFAILDSGDSDDSFDVTALTAPKNVAGFGAYYFPWLVVSDPLGKDATATIHIPPCGQIAGIYARSDANRGVFKAPANEQILGIQGLAYPVTTNQQEGLNPKGVNCLRSFYGTPLVWGARTVASGDPNGDPLYRYINVRRFMNFLRSSILQGVNWAVFEPNTPALWKRIVRSVGDFLLGQWRDGALFGDTPEKAFYVRCDATTNPPDVREQGQVVTEIGVAIVKPAEFVVFRIQQQTGG